MRPCLRANHWRVFHVTFGRRNNGTSGWTRPIRRARDVTRAFRPRASRPPRARRRGLRLLVTVLDEPELRVEHHRRRLVVDEILELLPELLQRQAGGGGELRELVRILEVVAAQANHVAARDRVARRPDVDHADARAARLRIEHLLRTGSARSGRPASRPSRRCRPRAGTSPRSSPGRACTPCRTASDRRSAARSRCSWRRSWS